MNGSPQSYFLWDGDELLAELDGSGTAKRVEYSYYPGMDQLHALVLGTTLYYAQTDRDGSVIALTDVNQTLQRTYSYDAWGKSVGGTDNVPFNGYDRARWKGALLLVPELDLYYMRSRWYEGGVGRFLSEDPLGIAGGANAYTFGGNDPKNNSDPTGQLMIDGALKITGCGGDPECAAAALAGNEDGGCISPTLSGGGGQSLSANWMSYSALEWSGGAAGLGWPRKGWPRAGDVILLFGEADNFYADGGRYRQAVKFTSEDPVWHFDPSGRAEEDWGNVRLVLSKVGWTDNQSDSGGQPYVE